MENSKNLDIVEGLAEAQDQLNQIAQDAQEAALELESGRVQVEDNPLRDRVVACIESIRLMNAIAGNRCVLDYHPDEALKVITSQERVFIEERNETFEALRHKCYIEILDGLSDMFVVHQGIELAIGQVSVEDIEAGKVDEKYAGHVGTVIHSEPTGALSNSIREGAMNAYSIARIGAEELFIGQLGVDPNKYVECCIEALELVCENNLSKFTQDQDLAAKWGEKFTKAQLKDGYHIRVADVDGEVWYSIVDGNGKFRKPKNFKEVDLQPVLDKLLEGVDPSKLADQEAAYEAFRKATKGV